MYSIALPTVWIFSASSSGIEISNSSSNSITSSTVSSESAPRSLMKEVSFVILSGVVPIWSQTILVTRSSIEGLLTVGSPWNRSGWDRIASSHRGRPRRAPPGCRSVPRGGWLCGRSEGQPPVDDQGLARDVGAAGARQELDQARHVVGRADAAQRDRAGHRLGGLAVHGGGHVGRDEARQHRVDAHAARGELLGHRARQPEDAGLAGGVV